MVVFHWPHVNRCEKFIFNPESRYYYLEVHSLIKIANPENKRLLGRHCWFLKCSSPNKRIEFVLS